MNFTKALKRTSIYAATVVLLLGATTANAACSDPAIPFVDWKECDKSDWNLLGANLSGADLWGVDLSQAKWTNRRRCGEGSIGECN